MERTSETGCGIESGTLGHDKQEIAQHKITIAVLLLLHRA